MAWPLGDLLNVVREIYARERSIRQAASAIGLGIGTVQDMLANPDRPRNRSTLETIQRFYETAAPTLEPGPRGSVKYTSDYWLDSQIEDIQPPRGATAFFINWQTDPYEGNEGGWVSSGWRNLSAETLTEYRDNRNIAASRIGSIRFARKS